MLEEALPLVIGVAVAMLPCLAFGSLAATRSFIFLGSGGRPGLCTAAGAAMDHLGRRHANDRGADNLGHVSITQPYPRT
jgi:hypothetical protein